jgi:hypothetical protein
MDEQDVGPLGVRFYRKEIQNEYLSQQEGRPVFYMADFVRIEVPGNNLSIIDTFANADHKKRFPIQWAAYQNEKSDNEDIQGTLLRDWPLLTSAQAAELKHYKFYTVEQVAGASDQQINAVGMLVGMSPYSFRDKARAYLANAKDSSVVQAQSEELRKRDLEIADLRAELHRIAQLSSQPEKRPPGRPKVVKE